MIDDHPRRWLHLPVETKARELQARLLLACVAAERGYGAVVGVKGHVNKMADRLPPGIFLEKSVQLGGLDGVESRNRLGHIECCLDEEGVVYIDADDYTAGRLGRPVLDGLHRFFAWGDDQAEIVAAFHPPIAGRIRVTGNPRVDFWRPELRGLHEEAAAELRRTHGHFTLFTTAFAMVNNSRGDQYFIDSLRANGRMDTAEGESQAMGYIAHSRKIFDAMGDAVRAVARARPAMPIVVRPHPSEDITTWEAVAADVPNVTVRREGAVTPWLLAAGAVVHNNSTTGLEATLLGRATVAFVPVTDRRYDQNLPNAVSRPAATIDELVDLVDRAFDGGLPPSAPNEATLRHHIAALDGPLASERLVAEFDRLEVPSARFDGGLVRRIRGQVRLAPLGVRRRIRGDSGVPAGAEITKARTDRSEKFPPTELDEVVTFIDRLRDVTGRFSGVTCTALSHKIFVVTPG